MNNFEYQIARFLAAAVRHMAAQETWVQPSALQYSGQTIEVHAVILGRPLHLTWQVDKSFILNPVTLEQNADVTLTIAPSIYSAIAQLPFDMTQIMRHIRISGDAGLAEWLNRLVQQLRPDVWEDLSRLIGDIPSQMIAQGVERALNQFKHVAKQLTTHAQHTFLDESPICIRHATLDEWAKDAQQLRYALERLEQRAAKLRS